MKIVVASGKGGTGKSMLASSLTLLFSKITSVVACDCDVDAPNLGLWLGVTTYDSIESITTSAVSYTHLRAHETRHEIVCSLLLEKKKRIVQ